MIHPHRSSFILDSSMNLSRRNFERILLIKPSAVGDVIHTIPVLAKLRTRYPEARIDWLLTPVIAELIQHHPALSNVVLFERRLYARSWRSCRALVELSRLVIRLHQAHYDLVIDLHGQFRSALLTIASGAPVRIGFDRPRKNTWASSDRKLVREAYVHGWTGAREGSWLAYSHRIPIPRLDVHAVDRYLWLGQLLGWKPGAPDFRIPIPEVAEAKIDRLLRFSGIRGQPLAVLVPGTIWETKHWHVEGFVRVARHLAEKGYAVVLAGSPAERPRCQAVVAGAAGCQLLDLAGQTALSELAALIKRAVVCVTNDSGSMHLAVALNRLVVSLFGPTDPIWVGPYGRPDAVVRSNVPCAPCYLRKLRACSHAHVCMKNITAEMVIERLETTLPLAS
jgi:lipopolysaccharide heptosyltransferase I